MNEMDEKQKFVVLDEHGKEIECEPLFTFESEEKSKESLKEIEDLKKVESYCQ